MICASPASSVQQPLGRVHRPWDEGSRHRHDQQLLPRQPDHQTGNLRCGSFAHHKPSVPLVPWPVNCANMPSKKKKTTPRQKSQFSLWLITFCFYKDAEARALAKERQKKDNHNLSKSHIRPAQLRTRVCCCSVSLPQSGRWTLDGGQWTVIFAALCPFS